MAFDFSYSDRQDRTQTVAEQPIVKIWNNKGNPKKNSYFFLNKYAVALLDNADRVRIGIDTNTCKIVITPSKDKGRVLSKMAGGSATISLKSLIEENDLPTQEFVVGYLANYAHGGLIFSYNDPIDEQ